MRWLVLLICLVLSGCSGIVTWATIYSSRSPDGTATLEVQETACFGDCALRIVVSRGWHTATIARKTDCAVMFAHAAWQGSVVTAFVDGSFCGTIQAAFDISRDRAVDASTTASHLRDHRT